MSIIKETKSTAKQLSKIRFPNYIFLQDFPRFILNQREATYVNVPNLSITRVLILANSVISVNFQAND